MKAAVKTLWVNDLRAHPEAQGAGFLDYIDEDGKRKQCCLGRMCLLAVEAGVIPAPELRNGRYFYLDDQWTTEGEKHEAFAQAGSLPRKVAEWAGLTFDDGAPRDSVVIDPANGVDAIEANDAEGYSFAKIADLADANVPAE
jgi:hypothetical protein